MNKPAGRSIEIDILRGFLLLWMTLTHLPTQASVVSNQTFGFVSGAEGFIFLAAFMVGQLQYHVEQKRGPMGALRDLAKRTARVYVYHCALLAVAFTLVAGIGVRFHRLALENLLSYYLHSPKEAILAALLLEYRPSLLDILPMYVIFMAITPLARKIARRWGWGPVLFISFAVWAAAQFGLRAWVYRQGDFFGMAVPESSTGSFDLYGWQMLWMTGLALGSLNADLDSPPEKDGGGLPAWVVRLAVGVAVVFCVLRYCPVDQWMDTNLYGWLIDKWRLGPARVINFSALAILLVRFGTRIAALPFLAPFALLGQASIEVFTVHVLCCLAGHALNSDADPMLPWWQQLVLLVVTLALLFATAQAHRIGVAKRREKALVGVPAT
ncbi:MAG TPA: OpgC domain-containing protein [Bryobacteraceae bacterium]|nr:OpgC domain-containing protein [Bryobacteraceae bacterium]